MIKKADMLQQNNNNPKVSVIVPCYNVAQWVPRCLESLMNQTLQDIEILVIYDKSTDNTLEILQQYAKRDNRIRVFDLKHNQGVSVARNTGIAAAMGEYIGFIDPDDAFDLNFYEVLYNKSQIEKSDIVKGNRITYKIDGSVNHAEKYTELNNKIVSNKYKFGYGFGTAIYKKDFLDKHKLDFPAGIITSEDIVFLAKCLFFANQVLVENDVYYRYFRREDSLNPDILSPQKIQSKIDSYKTLLSWANEQTDMSDHDYKSILRIAFDLATYPIGRETCHSDRLKLSHGFIWLYENTKNPEWLLEYFGPKRFKAVKTKDVNKVYEKFFVQVVRIRLFGMIPFIKIYRLPDGQKTVLFADFLQVFRKKISKNKIEIFVFGILLFKIKM